MTSRSRNIVARLVGAPLFWVAAVGLLFGVPIARSVTRKLAAAPAVLGRLPAFTLTDQTGRPFGTRELEGKVWVADFIFTSCQQACPTLSARMAEVGRRARHLGPDFHLVSISVDPERDTPAELAEYVHFFDSRFRGLTGTPEEIGAVLKAYGVYAKKVPLKDSAMGYTMDHSAFIYVYGPDGEFVTAVDPKVTPDELAAKLKKEMT